MVVVGHPIRFDEDDPRPMLRHLDAWARRTLTSPEAWGSALERCGQWVDYSARNQVLLASYGVAGPVAGAATWERVPSVEEGRGCAVRAGEHGLPVRVPVVDDGHVGSERSRSGAASESVARTHRWEPVFALEQLARRPTRGHARRAGGAAVVGGRVGGGGAGRDREGAGPHAPQGDRPVRPLGDPGRAGAAWGGPLPPLRRVGGAGRLAGG